MTRVKIGDLVAVDWDDAWLDVEETKPEDWKLRAPMTTYGILVRRGDIVSVASEDIHDGRYRTVTHVPVAMVRRVRRLA